MTPEFYKLLFIFSGLCVLLLAYIIIKHFRPKTASVAPSRLNPKLSPAFQVFVAALLSLFTIGFVQLLIITTSLFIGIAGLVLGDLLLLGLLVLIKAALEKNSHVFANTFFITGILTMIGGFLFFLQGW